MSVKLDDKTTVPLFLAIAAMTGLIPILVWAVRADAQIDKIPKNEKSINRVEKKVDALLILQGLDPIEVLNENAE